MLVRHTFPLDAEYSIKVRAKAAKIGVGDRPASGEELEFVLNGERVKLVRPAARWTCSLRSRPGPRKSAPRSFGRAPPGADDIWQIFPSNSSLE